MQPLVSQHLNAILVAAGFTSQHGLADDLLVIMAKRYVDWMNSARDGEARPKLLPEEPKFYWARYKSSTGFLFEKVLDQHPLIWKQEKFKTSGMRFYLIEFHEIPEEVFRTLYNNDTAIQEGRVSDQPDKHQEVCPGTSGDASPALADEASV